MQAGRQQGKGGSPAAYCRAGYASAQLMTNQAATQGEGPTGLLCLLCEPSLHSSRDLPSSGCSTWWPHLVDPAPRGIPSWAPQAWPLSRGQSQRDASCRPCHTGSQRHQMPEWQSPLPTGTASRTRALYACSGPAGGQAAGHATVGAQEFCTAFTGWKLSCTPEHGAPRCDSILQGNRNRRGLATECCQ